ncbi:MAG: STAS domain-containing protein [Planctomycetota bacterium]
MPGNPPRTLTEIKTWHGFTLVTFLRDRFDNTPEVSRLIRNEWEPHVTAADPRVIISLENLKELRSNLIGLFYWAVGEVKAHQGHLVICHVSPHAMELLDLCGASKVIHVRKTLQEAVDHIRQKEREDPSKSRFLKIFKG